MDFIKVRVKVEEPFKDGNILEGRFLRTGEILVIDESTAERIIQSGGVLTIMDKMIPNPLKTPALAETIASQEAKEEADAKAKEGEVKNAEEIVYRQEAEEKKEIPAPKKRGRKPKNG